MPSETIAILLLIGLFIFLMAVRMPIALSIGIASMLGGSVIIETVFSLPGLGSLIMSSILARDYPAVQGCVILFAVIIMAVNLLTDILYSVLDPRVKLQ